MYLCAQRVNYVETPAIEAVAENLEQGIEASPAVDAVMGERVSNCHVETDAAQVYAAIELGRPWDYYEIVFDDDLNPSLSKIFISGTKSQTVEVPVLENAAGKKIG